MSKKNESFHFLFTLKALIAIMLFVNGVGFYYKITKEEKQMEKEVSKEWKKGELNQVLSIVEDVCNILNYKYVTISHEKEVSKVSINDKTWSIKEKKEFIENVCDYLSTESGDKKLYEALMNRFKLGVLRNAKTN